MPIQLISLRFNQNETSSVKIGPGSDASSDEIPVWISEIVLHLDMYVSVLCIYRWLVMEASYASRDLIPNLGVTSRYCQTERIALKMLWLEVFSVGNMERILEWINAITVKVTAWRIFQHELRIICKIAESRCSCSIHTETVINWSLLKLV